jgi:hypothetical protein
MGQVAEIIQGKCKISCFSLFHFVLCCLFYFTENYLINCIRFGFHIKKHTKFHISIMLIKSTERAVFASFQDFGVSHLSQTFSTNSLICISITSHSELFRA